MFKNQSIAVMQPYFFPYIGYFQLINAVDTFVLYDDVNFIKGGWINRNRILLKDEAHVFNITCKKISSFSKINEIEVGFTDKDKNKLLKKIEQSYKNAPYLNETLDVIKEGLKEMKLNIADVCYNCILSVKQYLEIETNILVSSKDFQETINLDRADRLIEISKKSNKSNYINAIGGKELYDKDYFKQRGVNLYFIQTNKIEYQQFDNEFVPWLSIIDVMMFNSKEEIQKMLTQYTLV